MMTASGVGRLTRDPETRRTQNDKAMTKFGIAINHGKRGDQEDVSFLDCVVWGRTAETFAQYVKKGSQVEVMGQLHQERWEGQDGTKHSRIVLHVDKWAFVGPRPDSSNGGSAQPARQQSRPATQPDGDDGFWGE